MMPQAPVTTSVIVCVYNRPIQIVRCLSALIRSEGDAFELIVVDDGSTDDTPSQVAAFRDHHPAIPFTIVREPVNKGVAGARNTGIAAAHGAFILFTDSDCAVDPQWVAAMTNALANSDNAAVSGKVIDHEPRNYAERAYAGWTKITRWRPTIGQLVGNNMGFKAAWLKAELFDEAFRQFGDETDVAHRLASKGLTVGYCADAVVEHDHPMTFFGYLRYGYLQGVGSARFWYKYDLWGKDPYPIAIAFVTFSLGFLRSDLFAIPSFFVLMQVAILFVNEVAIKGQPVLRFIVILPLALLHSICRSFGVFSTWLRIRLGREPLIQHSRHKVIRTSR